MKAAVLELPDMRATGIAISHDMLESANRAAEALGRSRPFEITALRPGDQLPGALDLLATPGMGCVSVSELDAVLARASDPWSMRILSEAVNSQARVAASCSSVFLLARTGALDGGRATTSWFLAAELQARHPAITVEPDKILVRHGRTVTGGASLAHVDVMLAAIEMLTGSDVADLCARYQLIDRRTSQRPYMMLTVLIADDPDLVHAHDWIVSNLRRSFTTADLADAVGLHTRTLARRLQRATGLSPQAFVQYIRTDTALTLIRSGTTAEAAAHRVGYADASSLRRAIRRRETGRTSWSTAGHRPDSGQGTVSPRE
ncbi:GlxA family transcriptional regulator [Nocardia sp. SC052]|uniref:GlxA family transcriptional regulator n=1 Tax=Nocardia sichangensis TaxID=3385975 RepID=UPI0039A11FBD